MKIGIAVLAYNRPKHFKKVLDNIIKEKIKSLNVYLDGPKNENVKKKQLKIINHIKNLNKRIDINLIRQTKNNGLAFSVLNAVNSELKKNEAMILIEDDCVPQKGFFDYMFKSLRKYKHNLKVKSVCSYNNLNTLNYNTCFFLKRFNPWGWATWKNRWTKFNPKLEEVIIQLNSVGKTNKLPIDLKLYCKNKSLINGNQDIWSLSWTLFHYLEDAIILYPPKSLINNIGFDGSGVHCIKTNVFNIKSVKSLKNIKFPKKEKINFPNEIKNENFLIENSSKTFFKNKKLDKIQPFNITNRPNYLAYDQIDFYLEKFVFSTKVVDIHTHLFPSKFKSFYKTGIVDLLNYHYLTAELFASSKISPKRYYNLSEIEKAKIVWNQIFINQTPMSTSALGVLKVIQKHDINPNNLKFEELLKEFEENKLSENEIFEIAGIKKVVMTNNPFDKKELEILTNNKDPKYLVSIRLDDFFDYKKNSKIMHELKIKKINIFTFLRQLIKKFKPKYFALSTNNFEELNFKNYFDQIMQIIEKYNVPLMLLVGVKRGVNPDYGLAGDGLGKPDFEKLEGILRKYRKNKFLVTCLDHADHFKTIVLARKFQNLNLFGFWWFTNQESIIKDILSLRIEMLNNNFIPQHSDARILDQLIYKWNDFKLYYTEVYSNKYKKLVESGYKIKADDLEKNVYDHFVNKPLNMINN